jgi:solute carrier family 35 protein
MLIGAMIAASDDLTFNWFGYVFLLMNNLCTAAQGVVIKQKLVNKVKIKKFDLVLGVFFLKI